MSSQLPPIRFPQPHRDDDALTLSDDDHAFLTGVIGPCHGDHLERLLATCAHTPGGGRRIAGTDHDHYALLEAIGIEVIGYLKLEAETTGKPTRKPRRGGTAERLLTIYHKLDDHLS
jgi:hypothetical protein